MTKFFQSGHKADLTPSITGVTLRGSNQPSSKGNRVKKGVREL